MTATAPVFFNPLDPQVKAFPYPHYRDLREQDPRHHSPFGMLVLTSYDDVAQVLKDPRLSHDIDRYVQAPEGSPMFAPDNDPSPELRFRHHSMLNLDPPDHTRLRRLVSKAFTPRAIEAMRPHIVELVDDLLDQAAGRGEIDIIGDLAFPLPFTVISEMLGMPTENRDELRSWSQAMVRSIEPVMTEDEIAASRDAARHMVRHITAVVEDRRRHPGVDLLSALIAVEDEGDMLTADELMATVILLYIAGHETTVNLIGNGTLALLRHPGQLSAWRDDPGLDANAVDELLRYDGPVQFTARVTTEACEVVGERLEAGTVVMPILGAANHDPAHFTDPDHLDLRRADASHHVTFGGGIHFCLGASLARVEGQVAIGRLIRRFPDLALAGEPVWSDRITIRGLSALPVRV